MTEPTKKETPTQRLERIKQEKSALDLLPDIERYAKLGFDAIDKDDLTVRFRSWGLYTQGDGGGVRGKEMPYFMLRIRIPGGQLRSHQVRAIADLSERYARSSLDLTDRQNVQLHWLEIEKIPDVLKTLWMAGMNSQFACGDVPRNITACPVAGLERDELIDVSGLVHDLDRMVNGNRAFDNLPRKFKMTVTACPSWCTYPEINDIGLTAIKRESDGQVGFSLRVGGGLSTRPHLAKRLNAFLLPHEAPAVAHAVLSLFRDSEELRENRHKARMKFLFLDRGWDEERFLHEIEERLGYRLAPAEPEIPPRDNHRDHVGIHPQKQDGFYYVGFSVTSGRLTPAQYRLAAELADQFGDGSIRNTVQQNLIIPNIREERLPEFLKAAEALELPLEPSAFRRGVVACTGTQYCKLALTETKGFAGEMISELERRMPQYSSQIKIHVNGCPNACGQHWIADIGLQGVKLKDGSDGYEVYAGGGVAGWAAIAQRVPFRAAATDIPDAIERLLQAYLAEREEGEIFQEFARRHSPEELKTYLAGVGPAEVQ